MHVANSLMSEMGVKNGSGRTSTALPLYTAGNGHGQRINCSLCALSAALKSISTGLLVFAAAFSGGSLATALLGVALR
jgi:hypothetical protein